MTWNTLTNLAHEQLVVENHMDQIRQNIEHLGAMKIAGTLLSALATGTSSMRGAIGTYTGNASATKAITGVGFPPDIVFVWVHADATYTAITIKTAAMGANAMIAMGASNYQPDIIISLDSDGFTVGDNTVQGIIYSVNQNSVVYGYLALKF